MSTPVLSKELAEQTLRLVEHHGSINSAAKAENIPRNTLNNRYHRAKELYGDNIKVDKPFEIEGTLPSELPPIGDLIEIRKKVFDRKRAAKEARRLIPVKIKIDGPIGIVHMGDPHVDDDGTDISLVENHVKIINQTEGLFGANLGDLTNNWVGRLAQLYGQQSTSRAEAWALAEWLVNSVNWLYIIAGNHDLWSGDGDPIKWMMRQQGNTSYEAHGARLGLKFPNGKEVRINARHDFVGHSMWNPNHGPMKAAMGGWRDHILTAGHKHVSFITGPMKDPMSGLLSWAIRCAGYKTYDRYAEEKGFLDQNAFAACVTIIQPQYADDDNRLITVIQDVETGADFLKFLRKKK